jgi:hypothetical protein
LVDEYLEGDDESRSITSSDGDLLIYVAAFSNKWKYPSASIDPISSRSKSFLSATPLCQSMLFDTVSAEMPHIGFDFLLCGNMIVFEKEKQLNDHACLIMGNKNRMYYLDKDKDFSVVKKEVYSSITEDYEDGFRIVGRYLSEQTEFMDIQDFGNGIWLPNNVVYTQFNKEGKIIRVETIKVEEMKLNSGLQKKFFTDIIPENAMIADGIRGLVYRQSDHSSIDSLLKETVKSKRIFIYRYISIISGFALIFFVLIIKYRQYLKAKRERENRTEEIK